MERDLLPRKRRLEALLKELDAPQITRWMSAMSILPSAIARIEFGVTGDRLFLPLTEHTANL